MSFSIIVMCLCAVSMWCGSVVVTAVAQYLGIFGSLWTVALFPIVVAVTLVVFWFLTLGLKKFGEVE